MTRQQVYYKRQVRLEQISQGKYVADADLPRYYVFVELPRTPDFAGGDPPINWTRADRGGIL